MSSKSVLVKTNERPNNRLECPICKERFWLRCKYDDHVATHEVSKVSCNICSKSFYDQKLLDEHYLTHTNVIKTYNCKECERKFLQKYQLEQHMQFHKPIDFKPFTVNKKKSVHFNKVTHVKNIIDDTSESEEFHTSDSDDEEECNISDLEDYSPANKIVQTRSGRMVKRKKLFDEEETEIKYKSPKTEPACIRRSIIMEHKSQKKESSKTSDMDAIQKSPKTKQVYAKKSTVSEYNSQKKQYSKISAIDPVQKKQSVESEKKLSVVVEKMPDHIYTKYVKMGNVSIENRADFSGTQESQKVISSCVAKKPNNFVTSISANSLNDKKSDFFKSKSKQLGFENIQESQQVMPTNLAKKPHSSTTGNSITGKRSETTDSSKFTNRNIVNNARSCSKTVGKFSSRKKKVPDVNVKSLCKGTNNLDKSILSTLSQASAYKSPSCKEYMYVGPNPDFRKIKQAIEEVSSKSNHETSVCNNNSQAQIETKAQSKRVLNSPNSNISSKSNMQLSNKVSLTSFNEKHDKLGSKNPVDPINSLNSNNSQNGNHLNGSIPDEEGILEKKVVGDITVVKVTPEYMKKIQRNTLNQSNVPSLQNPHSPMTETVAASHLNSDLNKSSAVIAKNHEIKESEKSNATASMSVEANTINNVTKTCHGSSIETLVVNSCSKSLDHSKLLSIPNQQLTEITSAAASFSVSNSNESLTLSAEKHLASNLNKSSTTSARKPSIIRDIRKSNVIVNTSFEIDSTKTCQRSSVETPIVDFSSSSLEHAEVSEKHLASNLNESATACVEKLKSQKSNATSGTSIETDNNIMKTCQGSSAGTPSNSSMEQTKVLSMRCLQLPNNQIIWTASANASPAVTNSNSQSFLAGKLETANENQVSITSVKPYKVNNTKPSHQNNLIQSQVVYPVYLLHAPTIQSSNVPLLHTETPTVQSPTVSSVHPEIAAMQNPAVSVVITTIQTVQSPTVSAVQSKIQTPQTMKFPIKKNETLGNALDVNKNSTLSKGKRITKQSLEEPYYFTETSFEFNKNNLKTYQKVASENTQICQSNLNKLQAENVAENSIAESEQENRNELNDSIKSHNGNSEGNFMEDAVSSNITLPKKIRMTRKCLFEEPYVYTDNSFELKNNLKTYQKVAVKKTKILPQSMLKTLLQAGKIAENSVAESEQELGNELNDSIKSVNDNCKDNFTEDAVSSNNNDNLNLNPSNLIVEIPVSHNEKDKNKQISTQATLEEPQTENITIEVSDYSQTVPVQSRQQKNPNSDNKLHKDKYSNKNENKIKILPKRKRNLTVTNKNKETIKQSRKINNSFKVNNISLETCQQNSVEGTVVTLDENIQASPQSNLNDLLTVKPTDDSRTKSIGKEIKKRLRSHANKCESHQAITTCNKNKQLSLKRSHASSSKTAKKQKIEQNRTKHSEINGKKSKDVKNHTDLSNVSHNKNNESKETSKKSKDVKNHTDLSNVSHSRNNESKETSPKKSKDVKNHTNLSNVSHNRNNESKETSSKKSKEVKNHTNLSNVSHNRNNESKETSSKKSKDVKNHTNLSNVSHNRNNESKETSSKKSKDVKNHTNLSNVSHNRNNESKETSPKKSKDVKDHTNLSDVSHDRNNESKETSSKKSKDVKNPNNLLSNIRHDKNNENKETSPKTNSDNKLPKNLHEKLLQRYQAKLEEKEKKKKQKYEFKIKMKYIETLLSSPSRDSNEVNFSKGMLPSVNDIVKLSGKCAAETKKQTCVSQIIETSKSMPSTSKDSTDSSFGNMSNDSQKKNESENSKYNEETQAIAKARSITLKFNKDLSENESLQLLDELDGLIDTYNIGDKCPFLDKTIRFCCLFVDSYKVRQKAISLRNKLKNMKSS